MEDAVHRRECMITSRVDEKGWNKMDLESKPVIEIVKPTWRGVGLPGTHALVPTERMTRPQ
jgi:hypothetical protein